MVSLCMQPTGHPENVQTDSHSHIYGLRGKMVHIPHGHLLTDDNAYFLDSIPRRLYCLHSESRYSPYSFRLNARKLQL